MLEPKANFHNFDPGGFCRPSVSSSLSCSNSFFELGPKHRFLDPDFRGAFSIRAVKCNRP